MNRHLIYGPPGTGKTTRLLQLVESELERGVAPEQIAYLAFTRRAAREARERANMTDDQLVYFRTIHSLCFRALGLTSDRLMARSKHGKAFAELMGMHLPEDGEWRVLNRDDRALFLEEQARVRNVPLRTMYDESQEGELSYWEVERAARAMEAYKNQFDALDFTDILNEFLVQDLTPDLRVLFVDESQDLSPLQWRIIHKIEEHVERSYMAGDDDQAIFAWAGADVAHYQKLQGKPEYLGFSHRVPRAIQNEAKLIVSRIEHRVEKSWEPREAPGVLSYEMDVDMVDMSSGTWLVLARNAQFLKSAAAHCRSSGWWYEWRESPPVELEVIEAITAWERWCKLGREEDLKLAKSFMLSEPKKDLHWYDALDRIPLSDREYLRAMRRNGERLLDPPRIRLSTIHASKGGEADSVLLMPDMTRRSWNGLMEDPDPEHRVYYVGVTRARERLIVTTPRSRYSYEF